MPSITSKIPQEHVKNAIFIGVFNKLYGQKNSIFANNHLFIINTYFIIHLFLHNLHKDLVILHSII